MILCAAVYPEAKPETYRSKWQAYLTLARQYGFQEIFTTVHLPEISLAQQLRSLTLLSELAHALGMKVTVDIGGRYLDEILNHADQRKQFAACRPDHVRLDYGYSHASAKQMHQYLPKTGFVINASIYSPAQAEEEIRFLSSLRPAVDIQACHNYYPRPETGLDPQFARDQQAVFLRHHVPVYYCIPDHSHPRGPIKAGLPSVEAHRSLPADAVLLDLIYHYDCQAVMLADEFVPAEVFIQLAHVLNDRKLTVPVWFNRNATEIEKKLILREHRIRYDSNDIVYRSESSREMASNAAAVKSHLCTIRHRGSITVDNQKYRRYSGEVEVAEQDLPRDLKVNVPAKTDAYGMMLLAFHRYGYTYQFKEQK